MPGVCGGAAYPDQDTLILIQRQALAIYEFFPEVLRGRIIQLKLPLERAIGQAAPLAQEGDHLIQDRYKVHPVSPPYLALCLGAYKRTHHSIGDREGAERIASRVWHGQRKTIDTHAVERIMSPSQDCPSVKPQR
jgi:hypothetical protein